MTERLAFIRTVESGLYSKTDACRLFGISRKCGDKWLKRWEVEGEAGLVERSRAPLSCPHKTPEEQAKAIVEFRKMKPRYGPKKIVNRLQELYPEQEWPAPSTAGGILRRKGLVQPKRRSRPKHVPGRPHVESHEPNDVWATDFKGDFRLGNASHCYPLTMQDHLSRFLLGAYALPATTTDAVMTAQTEVFAVAGLPWAMLSDQGTPFASTGLRGLSRVSVWWLHLGIQPILTEPGRPDQNGRLERLHRDMAEETTMPPAETFPEQQALLDAFRYDHNFERPHEALGMKLPGDVWSPSSRRLPAKLEDPSYPGHFELCRVGDCGHTRFKGQRLFLTAALGGKLIGLEPIAYQQWSLQFNGFELGRFDLELGRLL